MIGRFVEACERRGLKMHVYGMMLVRGGKEGLLCEISVDESYSKPGLKFKSSGIVLHESGTERTKWCRKVANGRKSSSAIRSLVKY